MNAKPKKEIRKTIAINPKIYEAIRRISLKQKIAGEKVQIKALVETALVEKYNIKIS